MKYVIEFKEEPMGIKGPNGMIEYYPCINLPGLSLLQEDLDELTPYNREAIENDVWDFAWKMFNMDFREYSEMFDDNECPSDYRETKAKYEAWKNQKEIRVGDEVGVDDIPVIGIVTKVDWLFNRYHIVFDDGSIRHYPFHVVHKTGKHFHEVENLLKKMRGDKE